MDVAAIAAVVEENQEIQQSVGNEEMDAIRAEVVQHVIELDRIGEEYDEVKAAFKERIDGVKKALAEPKKIVRRGYRLITGVTLYGIVNDEENRLDLVTKDGELVRSRPLRPSERKQLNVFQHAAEGGR
jgi:hypothetical protein